MTGSRWLQFGMALAGWFSPAAWAGPMPSFDMPAAIANANVIVAGRVATAESGRASGWEVPVTLTLAVSRTIKGTPYAAGSTLTVDYVEGLSFDGGLFVGDFALFFLQCTAPTICTPAAKHYLSRPALPQGPVEASRSADVTERVIDELMALLAAGDQELDGLMRVVTSSGATPASVLRAQTAGLLSSVLTPTSIGVMADHLKALARLPAPGPRLAAIAVLADANDFSMLRNAEAEMLRPTPATEWLVQHLAHRMWSGDDRYLADLVAPMSRWLQSRDVLVRQSAASALRELGTAEAASALARTGLDDPDPKVRYFSVGGLIAAFGDGHYPSTELYEKDERRYLDPWLAWRDANRAGIQQGSCCVRPESPPEPPGVAAPPAR